MPIKTVSRLTVKIGLYKVQTVIGLHRPYETDTHNLKPFELNSLSLNW